MSFRVSISILFVFLILNFGFITKQDEFSPPKQGNTKFAEIEFQDVYSKFADIVKNNVREFEQDNILVSVAEMEKYFELIKRNCSEIIASFEMIYILFRYNSGEYISYSFQFCGVNKNKIERSLMICSTPGRHRVIQSEKVVNPASILRMCEKNFYSGNSRVKLFYLVTRGSKPKSCIFD